MASKGKLSPTDKGLYKLSNGKWRVRAYSTTLKSGCQEKTFDTKAEALTWKLKLEADLEKLGNSKNPNIIYIPKKSAWVVKIATDFIAGRPMASYESSPFASLESAQLHYSEVSALRKHGFWLGPDQASLTLGEFLIEQLARHKKRVKFSTYAKDEGLIRNHVLPYLGTKVLSTLTIDDLETWTEALVDKGLSDNSQAIAIKKLRQFLEVATKKRKISFNPANSIEAPSVTRAQWKPLTISEVNDLAKLTGAPEIIYFMVYTALRVSEAFALSVGDVDLEARTINVSKHFALTSNGLEVTEGTKTHQVREIAIVDDLMPIVQKLVNKRDSAEPLFTGFRHKDKHLNSGSFRRYRLKPALKTLGLEGGFHLLRKTCACLLLERGVKIENISRVLGHKDKSTTYKFYLEIYEDDHIRSVQALNGLFDPVTGDKEALEEARKRRAKAA